MMRIQIETHKGYHNIVDPTTGKPLETRDIRQARKWFLRAAKNARERRTVRLVRGCQILEATRVEPT